MEIVDVQNRANKPCSRAPGCHGQIWRDCIAAADDGILPWDREVAAQKRDVGMEADCAAQKLALALAARTPRTGEEAARVPAVAEPERRSRRAAEEVAVVDALAAVVDGVVRGAVKAVVEAAAVAAGLPDAGLGDGLGGCDAAVAEAAARAGAADTRGAAAGAAAVVQKAVAAAEVDGLAGAAADAGVAAGATRSGADRVGVRATSGQQQEGERKTAVFWSPCPYRHATVRAASYYLSPSESVREHGDRAVRLKCFDGRGQMASWMIRKRTGNAGDGEAGSWHDPFLGCPSGAVRAQGRKATLRRRALKV